MFLGLCAFSSSVSDGFAAIVVQACLFGDVVAGRMQCDLNIFLPLGICMTAVSPSILTNCYGTVQPLLSFLFTYTGFLLVLCVAGVMTLFLLVPLCALTRMQLFFLPLLFTLLRLPCPLRSLVRIVWVHSDVWQAEGRHRRL